MNGRTNLHETKALLGACIKDGKCMEMCGKSVEAI